MQSTIATFESKYKKKKVVDVRSGDTVRVSQKIKEGQKERVQVFEGLVIRTKRRNSATSSITVRRISSGIGVEKSFLIHSPLIEKIEVTKRSDVNRNYLTYMRQRSGKSARLESIEFDREGVNDVSDDVAPQEPKQDAPKAKDTKIESPKAVSSEEPNAGDEDEENSASSKKS